MRTLLAVAGLYIVHRVLLRLVPAYRERMQRMDRQFSWISAILVIYLIINALFQLFFYVR